MSKKQRKSFKKFSFKLLPPLIFFGIALIISSVTAVAWAMQSTTDTDIIYSSKQGSSTMQIWKMKPNRSGATRLTNDQSHELEWARPSPDGTKIIFTKADKGASVNLAVQSNRLWVMNIDGTNQREIISIAKRNQFGWTGFAHPEWSPDSTKIVMAVTLPNFTTHLFVVDANGNSPSQITQTTKIDGQSTNAFDPSWSKNNQIMYIRQWNCFGICGNHDVFKMDYGTRKETRITNDPNWNYDPYLSPDGKTYLWLSFRSSAIMCPCDLIRGSATGGLNPQPVIADGGSNSNGTFSGDSSKILFLKQVGNKQVLHRINTSGSGLASIGVSAVGEGGPASYVPQIASSGSNGGGGSTNTGGSTNAGGSGGSTSAGGSGGSTSAGGSSGADAGGQSNSGTARTNPSSGTSSGSQAGSSDNSIKSGGSSGENDSDGLFSAKQNGENKLEVFANKITSSKTAHMLVAVGTTVSGLSVGGFFLYRKLKKPKIRF